MSKFFRKIGQILFVFTPMLLTLAIQFIVAFPVAIYYGIYYVNSGQFTNMDQLFNDLYAILQGDYTIITTIAWAISSILVFTFWYRKIHKNKLTYSFKDMFKPLNLLGLVILAFGLQLATTFVCGYLESIQPQWFSYYNQLFDTAKYSTGIAIALTIYGIIGAPINEELVFRGVTLHYAQKAMPFWLANIFQAALFGLLHMNWIQGIYAGIAGLFLGYIYHKTGSIKSAIIFHIFFNIMGSLPIFHEGDGTLINYIVLIVLGFLIMAIGTIIFTLNTHRLKQNANN